jgi:regulator of sigma E protease
VGFNFNSIWVTLLLLGVLVVVHEYGHFITARLFGVRVYEFSVGFGPLIAKWIRGKTQYSFRWIPLGGYCKIAGMDIAMEGDSAIPKNETLDPKESFHTLSLWKQITVIAAGSVFNVMLAVITFIAALTLLGMPKNADKPIIGQVMPKTPAYQAGLLAGDRVTAINNQIVNSWSKMTELIQRNKGNQAEVQIKRGDKLLMLKVNPVYDPGMKRYLVGIRYMPEYTLEKVSFGKAVNETIKLPIEIVRNLFMMITGKIKAQLAGPIGMVGMVEQSLQLPPLVALFNTLMLSVNIGFSLAIINMLLIPLPLIDGGWITILLLERLFRRQFSVEHKAIAQMVGLSLFILLALFIGYGDVMTWIIK